MEIYKKGYSNKILNELEDKGAALLYDVGFLNIEFNNYRLKDQIIINLYASMPNYDSENDEPQEKIYELFIDPFENHDGNEMKEKLSERFYEILFVGTPSFDRIRDYFLFGSLHDLTYNHLVRFE